MVRKRTSGTPMQRILARVWVDPATNCWYCTGTKQKRSGHPMIKINARNHTVVRVVYEQVRGPIPGRNQLHHLCRHSACINPWHVQALTPLEHTHIHHKRTEAV